MKGVKKLTSLLLTASLAVGTAFPMTMTALAAQEEPRLDVDVVEWDSKGMDLTEVGATDWIYLGREGTLPPSDAPVPQDRKGDGAGGAVDIIQFSYLANTNTWNHFWDPNGTSFMWTDGLNKERSSGEASYIDMLRGFYGGNYADEDVGWQVSIPASEEIQTLTFVTGGVWAAVAVSVYPNGSETPAFENEVDAGDSGTGHFWKYTITVEPNTSLEVKGEIRHTSTGPDMITLAAAALSRVEKEPNADYMALLQESVDQANAWLAEDVSEEIRNALTGELAYAQPVLDSETPDNDAAYTANYFLSLALAAAEAVPVSGSYANTYAGGVTGILGWEGDQDAPIVWADGTYQLRNNRNTVVTFGVPDLPAGAVEWSRAEGYLPCLVSQYSKNGLDHTVESFADEVILDGKRYEAVYSRMTTTNTTGDIKLLPLVSADLAPLNEAAEQAKVVKGGETVVREYAILADRFNGKYTFPENSVLRDQGSYEEHYGHMKAHWDARVAELVDIRALPEEYAQPAQAYKAGYIDLLIAADGSELHPGEGVDSYDKLDASAVDMLTALAHLGHTDGFAEYAQTILKKLSGQEALRQISLPFAVYLQKTGDALTTADFFADIKTAVREIESAQAGTLRALSAYRYICETLLEETGEDKYRAELVWAEGLLNGGDAEAWVWNGSLANGSGSDDLESYLEMIKTTMTAPYGWWETPGTSSDTTILAGSHAGTGTGVCPYVPGHTAKIQAFLDAFLAEGVDGTIIVGRGLPAAFHAPGETVEIANYPVGGQRLGFTMRSGEKVVDFTLTGAAPENPVILELEALKGSIASVSGGCEFDSAAGTVTIPVGVTAVSIGLGSGDDPDVAAALEAVEAINAIGQVTRESAAAISAAREKYNALTEAQKALVVNYQTLVDAEATYGSLGSGSSGGGTVIITRPGGDTAPTTTTVTNPDGSETTTVDDGKGNVTETTKRADGTVTEKKTQANGTVTKTTTRADGSKAESVTVPAEGNTVTATDANGKVVAKLTIPAELPAAMEFADVPDGHWGRRAVDTVTALGLFNGTGEGFAPDMNMTRGMFVTVLHRLSGRLEPGTQTAFQDVDTGIWYGRAVAWAAENRIVEGVGDGRFLPGEELSREMLITILYRYADVLGLDTGAKAAALNSFGDKEQVSDWAADAMAWAAEKGLLVDHGGSLAPGSPAPRVEVASILTGFIGLLGK